ncbi:hypothetical protein JOL62DRAFT_435515 [Phyllosticta paracitricarpa]|uniref:Uncharacterized protein n=1 Tax=Phyllosticta paracitricarpa TaxID=2016321 RepID=A0ABR1NBU7_9PEZI
MVSQIPPSLDSQGTPSLQSHEDHGNSPSSGRDAETGATFAVTNGAVETSGLGFGSLACQAAEAMIFEHVRSGSGQKIGRGGKGGLHARQIPWASRSVEQRSRRSEVEAECRHTIRSSGTGRETRKELGPHGRFGIPCGGAGSTTDAIFVSPLLGRYHSTSSCKYYCTAKVVLFSRFLGSILTSKSCFDRNDATLDTLLELCTWHRSRQERSTTPEPQVPSIESGIRDECLATGLWACEKGHSDTHDVHGDRFEIRHGDNIVLTRAS